MKLILCTLLISLSALATEYNCRSGMIKLELENAGDMSSLIIRDTQTGEFYYNGIVAEVIQANNRTELMFETRSHNFLQLQFKATDLEQESDRLYGFARGWFGAGFIDNSIHCIKKI